MDYSVEELKVDIDMIVREDGVSPVIFVVGELLEFRASCKSIGIYAVDYSEDIEYEHAMAVVTANKSEFNGNTSMSILEYSNDYDTIDSAIHAYYLRKQG